MLQDDRQSPSRIRKDLEDSLLEEWQAVAATRFSAIYDEHRSALAVVRRIRPVPLAECAVHALLKVRDLLLKAVRLVVGSRERCLRTVLVERAAALAQNLGSDVPLLLDLGQRLPESDLGSPLEEQLMMRLRIQAVGCPA